MNGPSIRIGKWFVRTLVLAGAITIAQLAGADDFSIVPNQGVVDTVEISANKITISGATYDVAVDAHVEVGGSFGAFTLLKPGMNVEFVFRRYLNSDQREIIDVKEMPAGVEPKLM